MTHENNQGAENLNWMEIAESDAINDVRHSSRRLPFIAAAVSLLLIGAGAVFAQTSNEAPAQATENVVSVDPTASPLVTTPSTPDATGVPVIPNVAPSAGGRGYDDDEDEDHGWFGGHDDDDDDEYRGDRDGHRHGHGDDDDDDDDDDEYEDDDH